MMDGNVHFDEKLAWPLCVDTSSVRNVNKMLASPSRLHNGTYGDIYRHCE